jgi:hypothetical protein
MIWLRDSRNDMPLLKYFGFVGTALLLLLLGLNWLLPELKAESIRADIDKSVIRISSIEKLPARAVYDTSLPTIASPQTVTQSVVQIPQSAFAFVQITPGPLPSFLSLSKGIRSAETVVEPVAVKRSANRVARRNTIAAMNRAVPVVQAGVRLSVIDAIASGFGRSFSRLN